MDNLFSIPDFRINEKILGTLLKIRSITYKDIVVQTRQAEQKIWDHALKGNLIDFYRDEIVERERFGYPPFTTLVKITYEGKRDDVIEAMKVLKKHLEPWKVAVFPAFIETSDRTYVLHGLIKIAKDDWINKELLIKLRGLPQSYTVKIDPENLL
jgi:primosomal protein N' (replication factor Y)